MIVCSCHAVSDRALRTAVPVTLSRAMPTTTASPAAAAFAKPAALRATIPPLMMTELAATPYDRRRAAGWFDWNFVSRGALRAAMYFLLEAQGD
jgi:hypothetical protein